MTVSLRKTWAQRRRPCGDRGRLKQPQTEENMESSEARRGKERHSSSQAIGEGMALKTAGFFFLPLASGIVMGGNRFFQEVTRKVTQRSM